MQEILALHQKLTALLGPERAEEKSFDISRVDDSKNLGELPPELRGEIEALRAALNAVIPEEIEYYAFLAGEEAPFFGLDYNRVPCGLNSDELDPQRSLVEQLGALDWEAEKQKADATRGHMDGVLNTLDRVFKPLRSVKEIQRDFAEDTKDFIREKRRDANKIHLLVWDPEEELTEYEYATGEELRRVLPGMINEEVEIITVVAFGKPLAVKRIDALKADAQRTLQETFGQIVDEVADGAEQKSGDSGGAVIDVEAEVVPGENAAKPLS